MNATSDKIRERFIDADKRHSATGADEDWRVWQAAGVDYFLVHHPELARYSRLDHDRTPTVGEILALAEQLNHASDGVPQAWRLWPRSDRRLEHSARVAWFHESLTSLYAPVDRALSDLRGGDASRIETLIRFLEADQYCFRSGYHKADIIKAITRQLLDGVQRTRLRTVLSNVLEQPMKREFRSYMRLARYLDSDDLRDALAARVEAGGYPGAHNARLVLGDVSAR